MMKVPNHLHVLYMQDSTSTETNLQVNVGTTVLVKRDVIWP
jgi:hypothetical protein